MSKEITDLLGKLNGDMIALQGMEQKISPPPPAPPPTVAQAEAAAAAPVPPAKPKKEDYEYVKKLLDEVKGLCKDLEDQIDKETKVPQQPGEGEASPSGSASGSHASATSSAHKK